MKIHDKFVIELCEVIKGYGNDYQAEDPAHMPCDYKFYEIGGAAICEESFRKMKRLDDEINAVLNEIRSEIEQNAYPIVHGVNNHEKGMTLYGILQVINKYKAESEGEK